MNLDKIGNFIRELRKDKNMTQEELANKLHIGREAISKWENGKSLPDVSLFLELCKELNITTNELLYGERQTSNNKKEIAKLPVQIYKEKAKLKVQLFRITCTSIIILIIFLSYYFITTYNSIKIYSLNYEDNKIKIENGIIIKTNDHLYFDTGLIIPLKGEVMNLKLFYQDKDGKEHLIQSLDDNRIIFEDFKSYNDYIEFENIEYILKNFYLEIQIEQETITIPLKFNSIFSNSHLFSKTIKSITTTNFKNQTKVNKQIKEKFIYKDPNYVYQDDNYNYLYIPDVEVIYVSSNNSEKEWYYNLNNKTLIFTLYNEDYKPIVSFDFNNKISCNIGDCEQYLNEIDIFFQNLSNLLKKK